MSQPLTLCRITVIYFSPFAAFAASPEDAALSFLAVISPRNGIDDSLRSNAALNLSRLVLNCTYFHTPIEDEQPIPQ